LKIIAQKLHHKDLAKRERNIRTISG